MADDPFKVRDAFSTDKTVALGESGVELPSASAPPLASVSALAVGDVIGEGGMGVVRTAIQRSLDRTVAIKTTLPDARPEDAARMLQEAWVTGFLEHPGVVPVHDILRSQGGPVVVMRRIRGATWEDKRLDAEWATVQGAKDLLEQNLRIFVRVCEIVEFAHAKGVMHRDIKPANVMIGGYGEVYLLDWGLALALTDETAARLPRAGPSRDLAGTLAYAAPEMIAAIEAPLAEHTDEYLLGAVLFELATGQPPHAAATVTRMLESIAASPPSVAPTVPARLGAICTRAMAKDPVARHGSVGLLRREVLAFLRLRDSEHVVGQAMLALEALRAECATAHGGVRRRVYDLYGECRFAFREALHMWPDNETARIGLVTSATIVIERELVRDPRVAVALLEEAPELAPELVERVQRAAAEELDEREGLSKLARAHDQQTGLDARRVFFVLLGLSWTASQFVDRFGAPNTHMRFAVASLCELPLLGVAWMISRDLMKTLFNRRLLASIGLMLVTQSVFFFCALLLGVDLLAARVLQLGLWATVAACVTVCLERRFWPTTLAFTLALAVTVRWNDLRAIAGAASSLAVTINALAIWRRSPRPSKR